MSIKEIYIRNFQIHKELKLTFDKNFNILIGENNAGKSSIIRAIFWVFYNKPDGDWMQRNYEKDGIVIKQKTVVKITFTNGDYIKRIKGKGINKYEANGKEFYNFGRDIPEEIRKILRINKFVTNKNEYNLHVMMQEELPFLLHEPAPFKSAIIESLTGVTKLRKAASEFNKDILENSRRVTFIEREIESDEENLKNLPDLEKLKNLLDKAIQCNLTHEMEKVKLNDLKKIKTDYDKYIVIVENCKKRKYDLKPVEYLLEKIKGLKQRRDLFKNMNESLKDLRSKRFKIPKIKNVEELLQSIRDKKFKQNMLINIKDSLEKNKKNIVEYDITSKEKQEKLDRLMKKFNICPFCGKGM